MAQVQTSEEADAEYLRLMGEPMGSVFIGLHRKLIELHIVWQQYQQLFCANEETVQVLNRTSGLFFKIVQDELWDSVLLGISRFTDKPANRSQKNLTVSTLVPLVDDLDLRTKIQELCNQAIEEAKFARQHRNKRIAHQDHEYVSSSQANTLNGISELKVVDMLASLAAVLNALIAHFKDGEMQYGGFVDGTGARLLVHKLKQYEKLKKPSVQELFDAMGPP